MRAMLCAFLILSLRASAPGYVQAAGFLPGCLTEACKSSTYPEACLAGEPDPDARDATPDDGCARLPWKIATGLPLSFYQPYFDLCSLNDRSTCVATAIIVAHTEPASPWADPSAPYSHLSIPNPCEPDTYQQLAARLHCRS